eukprot:CAMPEP_0197074908 /NCGR_PEP_ID=MMETSP1384-20130603/211346_1 /TAXON_ID=29189 /ORGANISM="Ammonia sp." /LENGTH=417 /DNA_ID=CAMNT_0042513749 /DNA_START=58 /DNA_END=1312 /DNA_ORIENTATION=-
MSRSNKAGGASPMAASPFNEQGDDEDEDIMAELHVTTGGDDQAISIDKNMAHNLHGKDDFGRMINDEAMVQDMVMDDILDEMAEEDMDKKLVTRETLVQDMVMDDILDEMAEEDHGQKASHQKHVQQHVQNNNNSNQRGGKTVGFIVDDEDLSDDDQEQEGTPEADNDDDDDDDVVVLGAAMTAKGPPVPPPVPVDARIRKESDQKVLLSTVTAQGHRQDKFIVAHDSDSDDNDDGNVLAAVTTAQFRRAPNQNNNNNKKKNVNVKPMPKKKPPPRRWPPVKPSQSLNSTKGKAQQNGQRTAGLEPDEFVVNGDDDQVRIQVQGAAWNNDQVQLQSVDTSKYKRARNVNNNMSITSVSTAGGDEQKADREEETAGLEPDEFVVNGDDDHVQLQHVQMNDDDSSSGDDEILAGMQTAR